MSGIVGILQLDGAPVDRQILQRLTDFQSFRGPDAKQIWLNGNVGLGHTLLRTTEESERETQPFTLGDGVWIVADARVDGQRELIAELQSKGQQIPPSDAAHITSITDVELILRSYQVWGEDCLDHLIGDFTFGIWDGPRKQLFCARDQLGVKCFYYAHLGPCVIFSNSLGCIRQHPLVSNRLNDLAIADFLLFERNLDQSTTSFADIQRLPPAHKAVWSSGGTRQSQYWTPPFDEPVFYKRADDYTERFMELAKQAVSDRLRTQHIGILMSGGIDSSTMAAVACELSRERSLNLDLRAFTTITSFGPDEGFYAGLVAEKIGIPIEYHDGDEESIRSNWENVRFHTAEPPCNTALLPIHPTSWDKIGTHSRVFLQGEGPDNALCIEWKYYVSYLLRQRRYGRLLRDTCFYLAAHKRIPFWGKISSVFRKAEYQDSTRASYPEWINKDLESRFSLRARWDNFCSPPSSNIQPTLPRNHSLVYTHPEFWEMFWMNDAEATQAPVEVRFPFLDLRLLRFFLMVPSIPWYHSKYLVRRAMKGKLPTAVLRRPKETTWTSLIMERIERGRLPLVSTAPEFHSYVDAERLPTVAPDNMWTAGSITLARLFNHWLQYSYRNEYNLRGEALPNEITSKHCNE
jgi:asparagine synthase (glutamine-hydrolysing)